jgi:hypothetical protein
MQVKERKTQTVYHSRHWHHTGAGTIANPVGQHRSSSGIRAIKNRPEALSFAFSNTRAGAEQLLIEVDISKRHRS